MSETDEPVVIINILTPRAGKIDEVIAHQIAAQKRFIGTVPGARSSRLLRSADQRNVVMITVFDSIARHQDWTQSAEFASHAEGLKKLVENVEVGYYRTVSEVNSSAGDFDEREL
jgi:heme-degrading monooxygenase HmoA